MTMYLTGVSNPTVVEFARHERSLGLMLQPRSALIDHAPAFAAFAADNGAYGAFRQGKPFDPVPWLRFLDRLPDGALFVVVPDVVGDHAATADAWDTYAHEVIGRGHRPAFVLQNGCHDITQVPDEARAVFVGGDDAYKLGDDAARVCWQARTAGKWVHMGRANSGRRWLRALAMGCDSADGTFLRFGPTEHMLDRLAGWLSSGRRVGAQLDVIHLTGAAS